jgi:hypothetical protein
VWVQGGGIQPGYTTELQFDGMTYAGNPSIAPPSVAGGEIVLDGSHVVSLPVPNFDCAKASAPSEEEICADAGLSDKDRAMASAYRVDLQELPPDRAGELPSRTDGLAGRVREELQFASIGSAAP